MKVLVTPRSFGKTDPEAFGLLERAGFEVVRNDTGGILNAAQLAERLVGCDGVILGVDPLSAEVLAAAPALRAVAKYGVGTDNIDLAECERRGIKISITAGANANAVADYAFALLLAVSRKVLPTDAMCRRGDWSKTTTIDVYGKTLGLIGLGAVGKGVARRASGFDMRILAYDLTWDEAWAQSTGIERAGLERVCRESDFISVHVPLTDQTRDMIAAKEIAMMKPACVIINTARGGIISEPDLLNALRKKRIYGAGIDAFSAEPPDDPAWYSLENVVIGSHCAASTVGATEAMGRMAAKNIIRDLTGVNF